MVKGQFRKGRAARHNGTIKRPHKWDWGGMRGGSPTLACDRHGCNKRWYPWEPEDWKGNCAGKDTADALAAGGVGAAVESIQGEVMQDG